MTDDLTAHILPLHRTSRNECCLRVYCNCSLTMVRTVKPSGQGRLQVLYPINGYSTVREKKGIYADPGRTRVQVLQEYSKRSAWVIYVVTTEEVAQW